MNTNMREAEDRGSHGLGRMTNPVPSVSSVVLRLLIRVYSCPFVVASCFHYSYPEIAERSSRKSSRPRKNLTTNGHECCSCPPAADANSRRRYPRGCPDRPAATEV